ncbi:transposase domain-containing protein [Roseateles sp. DC23W]|uniref:Transposase domain-containing protein n=1 Tax=Pelomonas dachongensis TaxID=3299029 RepID=A0ABW7EU71_9BURK
MAARSASKHCASTKPCSASSARPSGSQATTRAYCKDVLDRLPTHPASRIDELLPHRRSPS